MAGNDESTAMVEGFAVGTTTATTVERTTTTWVDGRNGKMPWRWPKLIAYAALPLFLLLALIATPWAVAHIQGQLVDEATDDLSAAGIDPSGLDIDFDYRSGEATGVLPAGATVAAAEGAVDDSLLRDFEVSAEPAAPVVVTDDEDDDEVEAIVAGPVEVDIESDGSTVVVSGVVLDDDQRQSVLDAAQAAAPSAEVIDQLEVSGLAPEVDGADARILGLTTAIGTLAGAETWSAVLTDQDLTVRAAAQGDQVATIEGLAQGIDAVPTTVEVEDLTPEPDPAEAAVASLQTELDALIPEIKANVVFASGSDVLTPAAQSTLDKVVAAMDAYPGPVVDIVGHTDDVGD
ncbi:MAG: hypothetical protein AAFO29_24285, partial [Actinomycetota bacterium]